MIKALTGNILESKAQTLVNTVNCVGVMGKGIALEFKNRFPEMFKDYEQRCRRKEVMLGKPYLYKSLFPPWVLNFPTKGHWRSVSNLQDIVRGLILPHQALRGMGYYVDRGSAPRVWTWPAGVEDRRTNAIQVPN